MTGLTAEKLIEGSQKNRGECELVNRQGKRQIDVSFGDF
jgi:hypothetical protein